MMKYRICDLSSFPYFANDIQKSIHQFNLDEDELGLPENQQQIFAEHFQAIDLDKFEELCRSKCFYQKGLQRGLRSTTDMAFLACDKQGKEWAVLVEYRLNYKSPRNLKRDKLAEKVYFSSKIVQRCFKKSVYQVQYFVFSEEEYSQMRRKIERMKQESDGADNFKAVTIQMLFDEFFAD